MYSVVSNEKCILRYDIHVKMQGETISKNTVELINYQILSDL